MARANGVFAGAAVLDLLARIEAPHLNVIRRVGDGASLTPGTVIASLSGPLRRILGLERSLLNFLQRLCGVATMTRRYVDAIRGTGAGIYDTRKTIPGWRQLDKYAVRCGGGHNHRTGLHDAVLVKDNHLADIGADRLAGRAFEMLNEASDLGLRPAFVEFEVDTLEQLDALLTVVGIDVILLDNFTPAQLRDAVGRRDGLGLKGRVALEASGGISLEQVREIAETGIERISVGGITHSAPALDLALDVGRSSS
jgi:nicotinate-nucleotide pyrophosphorylase (carboxylating)